MRSDVKEVIEDIFRDLDDLKEVISSLSSDLFALQDLALLLEEE